LRSLAPWSIIVLSPGRLRRPAWLAVNLPNSITLIRILSIPLLIWILSTSRFHSENGNQELLASALFIAASITDGIDGYLARKRGQITTMGILLDPLADKLLIAAAFVALVQFNPSLVPAWIAVIIIGREFLVSGLRSIAASEGFTIEASDLGKLKMVVQIVSVVAVILDHHWKEWPVYGHYVFPVHWIAYVAIWFVICVSLVSAVDYFAAFWSKIDRRVSKRRRRAFILSRRSKPRAAARAADADVAPSTKSVVGNRRARSWRAGVLAGRAGMVAAFGSRFHFVGVTTGQVFS
jgi:CDP-diacylglycerol--glycerol-3-phosphate 3-phosphatidyltransferase